MKKFILDLTVNSVEALSDKHVLIKLTDDKPLPEMLPGQFVEVRVDNSPSTFLRRPISINNVDYDRNELWLLVAAVGDGTRQLQKLQKGDRLNCMLPLGNSFTMPTDSTQKVLLVGGGVGVAPLLYFGKRIKEMDFIEKTEHIDKLTSKRGAYLYRFNKKAYNEEPNFKL